MFPAAVAAATAVIITVVVAAMHECMSVSEPVCQKLLTTLPAQPPSIASALSTFTVQQVCALPTVCRHGLPCLLRNTGARPWVWFDWSWHCICHGRPSWPPLQAPLPDRTAPPQAACIVCLP